jgi:hypothetical protein
MLYHIKAKDIPFLLITFILPLILFTITSSSSLMFDDAAEFATVIKLGSIAHPPGTPAYILAGMLWTKITSLFGMPMIASLNLFASVCISISALLLYFIFTAIGSRLNAPATYRIVSCGTALAFATAATTWAWANTIEVYSFQVFAMAIALFGLVSWQLTERRNAIIVASIAISLGLGNHHLTMIAFLPFTVLFFMPGLLIPAETVTDKKTDKKKKVKVTSESFFSSVSRVFRNKNFGLLVLLTSVFTLFFYGWMFWRAQSDYPFMFGQPDTLSELFYHMRGGSYAKNLSSASTDIISSRLPYFLKLTGVQLFLLLPFFLLGIAYLVARKLTRLMWMVVLFFLILFIYQLNNNQWSSTDAYMLLPFMTLYIVAFYAIVTHINKFKLQYVIPVIVVLQIAFNFKDHDRRTYPVSGSLMELLDKSAPKNSVIMISDWSTVIQYYYYRIVENFRPDLVVLNYDIKFTHYKILPELYPEYYKKIKPEYDHFIDELGKEHPHQVKNTGCDLSTNELMAAFKATLARMEAIAKKDSTYFLTDPHAHYFYSQQNLYDGRRFVSGGFSSSLPGDSTANNFFIELKLPFLDSPLLYKDPAALDKLVDFQAMLDRHIEFYQANNQPEHLAKAEAAKSRILKMQREMKKSMAFAYKIK